MLSWLVLGRKKPTTPFVADQRSKKVLFFEILILLLIFCGSFGAKAMVSALPAPSQMNVLLISIDTLRADALGCYSPNSPSYTPNIDTLAGRGLRFANAYANSPWTLPSHGAMMASALPTHLALSSVSDKLAESNLTLAEHFLENGYNTFAVVNHLFVAPAYGFGQGFSDFQTIPESKSAAPVATGALAQMKQAERPWFGFVHFFTPHWPYGNQAPPIDYYQFLQQAQRFSSEEIQNLKSAYLQEVWAVDIQIGRIVAFLKQSGQLERTVVLITSDHGEAFGEKGVFGHGYFLDEPALRIPWILVDPKRPAARVSEMTVDLLDVAPTLAALAKTGSAPSFQGRDLSSLFDDRSPQQKPVFAQTSLSQDPATAVVFDQKKFITPIVASYKDLRFERSAALFDLSTDPTEDQNLLERKPEVVSRLMKLIQKAEGDSPADAKPAFLTKQETERLKTLGYLP
jgi:arylsulfatase A-like enzyme